jgi:alkylation response protein AidB-like acyl-CoA dehydrogenase
LPSLTRVPEENRLQEDKSFRDTARVLKMTRYMVAWEATGCAMGAYENALKYAQERLQFGKLIGSFQLVQDLLAKMIANITASQCLVVRTAQLEADRRACGPCQGVLYGQVPRDGRLDRELLGGNGIVADYNVGRFFADAEALYSYEGTYQMQNLIVGKAVTGLSAFL